MLVLFNQQFVCFQLIQWTQKAPKWTPVSVWLNFRRRLKRGFEWSVGADQNPVENISSDPKQLEC